ncbi:hypothetical protein F4861DRAFT_126563 [Xylaria intraflava]|nr:hypothetical protein F4861DRAFT_126563 [Xylaria intraflava]
MDGIRLGVGFLRSLPVVSALLYLRALPSVGCLAVEMCFSFAIAFGTLSNQMAGLGCLVRSISISITIPLVFVNNRPNPIS